MSESEFGPSNPSNEAPQVIEDEQNTGPRWVDLKEVSNAAQLTKDDDTTLLDETAAAYQATTDQEAPVPIADDEVSDTQPNATGIADLVKRLFNK